MAISFHFTERQRQLILNALTIMHGDCYDDTLHEEAVEALGGTPDEQEVMKLINKLEFQT